MKIISWNVNGIRAWHKKGALDWILKQSPDIFCIQETKAEAVQLTEDLLSPKGYTAYFSSSNERKGHSGTAIYTKEKPQKVTYGLGVKKLDQQGRQINVFYENFVLINCYFPNGGGRDKFFDKLLYKFEYYDSFLKFVIKLKKSGKKVIFCGDVNVAHEEIDIARPKGNEESVGFLPEERSWVDEVIAEDYVDTFRELHPKIVKYSWWDVITRARDRNVGWRIDYFFVDKRLEKNVKESEIHDKVLGSDHAPISLEIESVSFIKDTYPHLCPLQMSFRKYNVIRLVRFSSFNN